MHRRGIPSIAWLGLAALCGTSCTEPVATLLSLRDSGGTAGPRAGSAAGAGGSSGTAGIAGNAGSGGRPRGGPGPHGGDPRGGEPPDDDPYCPYTTPDFSRANEDALVDAVNEAISAGELCLTQRLDEQSYLGCTARGIVSPRAPQPPPPGWTFSDFPYEAWLWTGQGATVAEALASLEAQANTRTEDRESLCDAAKHTVYRSAGVAQRGTTWVFLLTE